MRNHRDRPGESGPPHLLLHEPAVDDHAARTLQQPPRHRHAFVVRPDLQLAHALGVGARFRPPVVFAFAHVGVPIAALDREVRDQVVQVRLVHHYHAGMAQRGLVDETVISVVADLVHRDIEAGSNFGVALEKTSRSTRCRSSSTSASE